MTTPNDDRAYLVTHLGIAKFRDRPPKPTARGTTARYSSAFDCSRKIAYMGLGFEETDPMDGGDAIAPWIGTLIHEATQEVILAKYPEAEIEVSSENDEHSISGSTDALIPVTCFDEFTQTMLGGTHILWELKSMGEYAFDKQMGYDRKRRTATDYGAGPSRKAVAQAGMNALNIMRERPEVDIQSLAMGTICVSPLSVQKARRMGIEGLARGMTEFVLPRKSWEALAEREMRRLEGIAEAAERGYTTRPIALDDDGNALNLDPNGSAWQCDYCSYRSQCLSDGQESQYVTTIRGAR